MKLLIELPEHNLNVIKRFIGGEGVEELLPRIIEDLIRSAYLGIALDNLTNGEVMQKMFPNTRCKTDDWKNLVWFRITKYNAVLIDKKWWNRKWGE